MALSLFAPEGAWPQPRLSSESDFHVLSGTLLRSLRPRSHQVYLMSLLPTKSHKPSNTLFQDLRSLIIEARQVNSALVLLYWRVGSNFSLRNLWHMLRFAEVFPDERIVNALSTPLGWTYFRQL